MGWDADMEIAKEELAAMTEGNAKVVVRILVLPRHVDYCHEPALMLLSKYKERVAVSILDQYGPAHQAFHAQNLKGRPTGEEIVRVRNLIEHCHP